jgi:cytoskeleton protein RodZ
MPEVDLLSAAQSTLPPSELPSASAGTLLRLAREAAQVHRASLAGLLKVPVKKIEALESDDWQALPDLAFTRALASSICRQLKIDAQPILALLPAVRQEAPQTPATLAEDKALAASRQKLSTAPGSSRMAGIVWATAGLFVLGAVAAAWWWQSQAAERSTEAEEWTHTGQMLESEVEQHAAPAWPASAANTSVNASVAAASSANATPSPVPSPVVATAALTSTISATATAAPIATPAPVAALLPVGTAGLLELQAKAETWVQVRDAQKKVQISRLLHAGERVQVRSQAPYQVWIGRAEDLQLLWQGKPVGAIVGKAGSVRLQIPPAVIPAQVQPPAQSPAQLQH